MKGLMLACLCFLLAGCASTGGFETYNSQPAPRLTRALVNYTNQRLNGSIYYTLVEQLKSGKSINFNLLRLAYTQTRDYSPYDSQDQTREDILYYLEYQQYRDAITLAEKLLETNYVDIESHFVCGYSYSELGDTRKAQFHKRVYNGLIEAILDTGEGASPDDAFVVITPQEQQQVLLALGLEAQDRSVLQDRGFHYEVFDVKESEGDRRFKVFFNIDLPASRL